MSPFEIVHKRGSTFAYIGPGQLPAGAWTARSQIRGLVNGRVLATLVCTLTPDGTLPAPDTHVLTLESADNTATWLAGSYVMDVKFYAGDGGTIATQTVSVQIVDRVTVDA